jgi:hypothetical protein
VLIDCQRGRKCVFDVGCDAQWCLELLWFRPCTERDCGQLVKAFRPTMWLWQLGWCFVLLAPCQTLLGKSFLKTR